MKYLFQISALVLITLFVASCKKDDSSSTPPITITVLSPQANAVFHQGETLHLNATVASPVDLHGYSWSIRKQGVATTLKNVEEHTHERNFTITDSWVVDSTAAAQGSLELTVTVEVDHEGNEVSTSVPIKAQF